MYRELLLDQLELFGLPVHDNRQLKFAHRIRTKKIDFLKLSLRAFALNSAVLILKSVIKFQLKKIT
jgi:hypothetical protein